MQRFALDDLEQVAASLAEYAGVEQDDARLFARILVDADLRGISTHGLSRLGIYLERLTRGLIDPRGTLHVVQEHGAVLSLDAANGLGQVAAVRALERLLPLARTHGVASATIRRSQHFGALGYYTDLAAAQGMILLAMTNCEPAMAPAGGVEPFFGTNPLAVSFPVADADPIRIDLATSIVARGNIVAASRKGHPIPEGWALTRDGQPTTDAAEALQGAVRTMAGHKGYALALMVEMFSSVLSGSAIGPEIGSMYKDLDRPQDVGHFFCLFDIQAFLPRQQYDARTQTLTEALKRNRRQSEAEEILLPGERRSRTADFHRKTGIPLGDETVAELQTWCERAKVPFVVAEEGKQEQA